MAGLAEWLALTIAARRLRNGNGGHHHGRHHPAGRQPVVEPPPGAGQTRLDRPHRAAQRRGGLGVRPATQFTQHDRQAELVGEAIQSVVEQAADLAVGRRTGRVRAEHPPADAPDHRLVPPDEQLERGLVRRPGESVEQLGVGNGRGTGRDPAGEGGQRHGGHRGLLRNSFSPGD
jgi:hypothetical protein